MSAQSPMDTRREVSSRRAVPAGSGNVATERGRPISVVHGPSRPEALQERVEALFARQVGRHPHATAVEFDERPLSYAELDARSDEFAGRLRAVGVLSGELVAVALEPGPLLIVSLWGIVKAGAAFVPLDPQLPRQRLADMLQDCGTRVLVTQKSLTDRVPTRPIVCLLADEPARDDPRLAHGDAPIFRDERVAYAIFTSGSTGRPKAALLTHAGLSNLVHGQRRAFGVSEGSRVLQFASVGFDAVVSEIFVTLCSGATLCTVRSAQRTPGPALHGTLSDKRITLVTLPPSVLALIPREALPDLRTLVVAGERCGDDLASYWSLGRNFINAYGPTETTVCATTYCCPEGRQPAPPIGSPLPNVSLFVLDDHMRPVSPGEPGELYVGGACVGLGYLNRPELTRQRFVHIKTINEVGMDCYRTGDRVVVKSSGILQFLGRSDHQIKIRGVRIELDEIARVIERQSAVRQAIVVDVPQRPAPHRLVGFIVGPGSSWSDAELKVELRKQLPAVMVPSRIVATDRMPLTATGKIDRSALLQRVADHRADPGGAELPDVTCPRDRMELLVARQWAGVLGHESFGVHDNFFDQGGDSLMVMELLSRLERELDRELSMAQLVEHPTVEGMADRIGRQLPPEQWSPIVALQPRGSRRPFFCVHPGGGNALCYRELSRHVGADQPFYALQAPGVDGIRPSLRTVEEMATEYIRAIRQVQSEGPYAIGGWSFGGIVAYEIAVQLTDQGHHVAPLVIIDAGILYSFAVVRTLFHNDNVPLFHLSELDSEQLLPDFHEASTSAQLVPPGASRDMTRRILTVFKQNVEAAYSYRPRTYPAEAVLIRSTEPFLRVRLRRDPLQEWTELCQGGVQQRMTSGNHLNMMHHPHAAHLAQHLRACLAAANC